VVLFSSDLGIIRAALSFFPIGIDRFGAVAALKRSPLVASGGRGCMERSKNDNGSGSNSKVAVRKL
jgi:hypothetical protein